MRAEGNPVAAHVLAGQVGVPKFLTLIATLGLSSPPYLHYTFLIVVLRSGCTKIQLNNEDDA